MGIIRISNLRLRTIIGINDWERTTLQDVVVNIEIEAEIERAAQTDSIDDTLDYKNLTKQIIQHVEESSFQLIERLASSILDLILTLPRAVSAKVKVDKPGALRFADSVSVELSGRSR